jgi:hypothetical protein
MIKKICYYSASATWMVNFAFVWAVLAQNALNKTYLFQPE